MTRFKLDQGTGRNLVLSQEIIGLKLVKKCYDGRPIEEIYHDLEAWALTQSKRSLKLVKEAIVSSPFEARDLEESPSQGG